MQTSEWERQEADDLFQVNRLHVGEDVFEDFDQWEREVGTWDELKERLLLSDACWVNRAEEDSDGYPEIAALVASGVDVMDAMAEVWGEDRFTQPNGFNWWSWKQASQRTKQKLAPLFITASKIKPRRQRWLWTRRIPSNEVSLLAGVQGRGKSMLLARLISGVTTGEFGNDARDVVLFSAEEDPETTISPRLIAAGADMDRVHIHVIEKGFTLPRDVDVLRQAIDYWDVGLVVIDPLLSYLDDDTDAFKPSEVRRALRALNVLKGKATILGLIHFRKESAGEVIHMVTSSSAFTEVPRSVVALGAEPEAPDDSGLVVLVHLKCNVGKKQRALRMHIQEAWVDDPDGGDPIDTARMMIDDECDLSQDDVFKPKQGRPSVERDNAKEFLQRELNRHGGRIRVDTTRKKAVAAGIASRSTIDRAKDDLGLTSFYDEAANIWCWQEPDWTS